MLPLLANLDTFQYISRYLNRGPSGESMGFFLAMVCTIALLWLGVNFVERYRKAQAASVKSPRAMFYELCLLHGLCRTERNLLSRRPGVQDDELCLAFIDSRVLGRLSLTNTPDADAYARLAKKLFGERRC